MQIISSVRTRCISIAKKVITELLQKPKLQQSNLTTGERLNFENVLENCYLTIKEEDK